jgi:hypothetical protein
MSFKRLMWKFLYTRWQVWSKKQFLPTIVGGGKGEVRDRITFHVKKNSYFTFHIQKINHFTKIKKYVFLTR